MVRLEGLEPPRISPPEPKSGVSANFTTAAFFYFNINPIYLHTTLLPKDDIKHKHELYFPYMKRVWGYLIYIPLPYLKQEMKPAWQYHKRHYRSHYPNEQF